MPFAALHDGHGYLLDSFDFTYLTSGRDLLFHPQGTVASSVVVFADPHFTAIPTSISIPSSDVLERFLLSSSSDPSRGYWVPLPGTRREAQSIQHLLPQAQLFLGPEATKERLMQLPAPGILHIATHGFLRDPSLSPEGSRGVVFDMAVGQRLPTLRPGEPLMLRSGLVLSEATTSSANPTDARKTSMVTALELAGLNLWGTQLVVLSACNTGNEDVQSAKQINGLRRALVVAGAETVVMSLGNVNDASASLLMESYYGNLLNGMGRTSALREAMRSLRVARPHPHDWAPFIALGIDDPLRGIHPSAPGGSGG